jgi:cytochrome P450 family 9
MGIFQFRKPLVILRDPELIKQVGVKEFDNYVDHQTFLKETMDPLFCNSIVGLTGDKWREMRAALSPVFTGSKMRHMFEFIATCSSNMVTVFKAEAQAKGPQVHEMKDVFTRFTNDVVATTAFGLEVNSFKDRDNEVYKLGQRLTDFKSPATSFKMMGFFAFPWLMTMLKLTFLDGVASRYFAKIIRQNFETRTQEKIVRNDVVQLLMQLKKGNLERQEEKAHDDAGFATVEESEMGRKLVKREWTEIELIAQCFIFFLGGFDTTSTMLSFLSYELALNPEVQQRLFEEIAETDEELNGKSVTYEVLQKMTYLDAVVSESLRKWPPAVVTDRLATRSCTLQVDETSYAIEKGTSFWFPIYALHHDEKYFPNPDKFDPERFHDEERRKGIKPYTYLPFGVGPRNCIGEEAGSN